MRINKKMKQAVITLKNITKYFPRRPQLMRRREKITTYLFHRQSKNKRNGRFLALDNISFEIFRGESVGIVGSNGAGKSTLLRVITGITIPSSGEVIIKGEYRELFALNAGFNVDLSGRKNIYLYAAMKNIPEKEIKKKENEIISFANLEEFIDEPIKNYSSGMRGRLGFSLITHTTPDILFIDEALSAGDTAFKKKCNDTLLRFKQEKKTLVIVSHGLGILQELCTRIIWLDKGTVKMDGPVDEVLLKYQVYQDERGNDKKKPGVRGAKREKKFIPPSYDDMD
jgi:ABC-type polysaccharide/polyol phosphate transport system ATPase subunit